MTSQTPEECRHCKVAEAQGVTHIHPEVDTTEIEEIVEQFEKRMPLITSHGLLLEARLTPTSYLKMKEWLRTTLLSQQQKHRETWLREEKVFWQSKQVDVGDGDYCLICKQHIASGYCKCTTKNQTLKTIIDRYQAELEGVLEIKK